MIVSGNHQLELVYSRVQMLFTQVFFAFSRCLFGVLYARRIANLDESHELLWSFIIFNIKTILWILDIICFFICNHNIKQPQSRARLVMSARLSRPHYPQLPSSIFHIIFNISPLSSVPSNFQHPSCLERGPRDSCIRIRFTISFHSIIVIGIFMIKYCPDLSTIIRIQLKLCWKYYLCYAFHFVFNFFYYFEYNGETSW